MVNKNKNCSELKITVVNVKRESDGCLEAGKADAMPLDHPRVRRYAGSQKYDGDFTAPSKPRIWATSPSPQHTASKHSPAQIYLCDAPSSNCAQKAAWLTRCAAASRAAAPRPLPTATGAGGKGRRTNHPRNTSWLRVCTAPTKHVRGINPTSSYPLELGNQARR